MRILLPTGAVTASVVQKAADGLDAHVVVSGEIASFLTPAQLEEMIRAGCYDLVIVSGMCTASFADVEARTRVPIYRGPRHAADLHEILRDLPSLELSRTVPADDYLAARRSRAARGRLWEMEERASCVFMLRGVKIGGNARMKVLAEIMDAHRTSDLRKKVDDCFCQGADIVDIGFGFDAVPADVCRCFDLLDSVPGPLAIDSQDPALILAALPRADLVLSLQEDNIPRVSTCLAAEGTAAVVVPGQNGLAQNLRMARKAGVRRLIADSLTCPVGSGLVASIGAFPSPEYPTFFGAGNVVELTDADSPGMNALLAGIAHELHASVLFSSEHSDKTRGSVGEMRRASEMMALMGDRPYPKDLGLDLLVIKEKRRRREPPLSYREEITAGPAPREITYDPCGNFRIGIDGNEIIAVTRGAAVRGQCWADVFNTILKNGDVSLLDHAAYLGAELFKAELAIRFGRSFEQDGPF
ncbi:MAG: dihydropteroate synthase [Methanomicrobiales archaeon]|nr:dihydropteroate synthase [Methanomicrobiales archaeon]